MIWKNFPNIPKISRKKWKNWKKTSARRRISDELYKVIDEAIVIEGSKKTYTAEEIKSTIDSIREDIEKEVKAGREMVPVRQMPLLVDVTRAHGLRNKVIELLDKEKDTFAPEE